MFSKRIRKTIAAFFLVLIVQSVVAPTLSYALTAGPTAPEATSFEPVDTTDLVDLKTGDFTYNVPLLEVPGPAGSYPLNLSYHAGIQPNQEASWTGLGFTLNPGSISRLVNGYPDDHDNVTGTDRSFWKGDTRESYQVGLSVGVANVGSVSAGLEFAQDTYKGRGVGGYVGGGINVPNSNIGIHATMGISAYGDIYGSAGVGLGVGAGSKEGLNAAASVGLKMNLGSGISGFADAGVNSKTTSLLGASISSDGSKPSLSIGGGTAGVYNAKANHVSVNADNFQVDIPIGYSGVNLRLGRNYQRSWIDETSFVHTYGSLYSAGVASNNNTAFDTYDLLDLNLDAADHSDPEKVLGGSFPDNDIYTVMGQGISGNLKPYHFKQHLNRQDRVDGDNELIVKNYPLNSVSNSKPVEFGFINDFSNRFEFNPGDFNVTADNISFEFSNDATTGESGNDGYSNNHLAGSKNVEWYTNSEVLRSNPEVNPFAEGFIDCQAEGFQRDNDQQIGGYSITSASGVTYHYALPAYSYEEYMKSQNSSTKQDAEGLRYNELRKPEKYAYTWYLTAVTGPDFVDRNSNGLADNGDWGYWVNFQYKKWLSDYKWRNPGEEFNQDLDREFEFFSCGKKEIYYLDKILTQSHVAVFEKSLRHDGREVSDLIAGGFTTLAARPSLKLDKIRLYDYASYVAGKTGDSYLLRAIDFEYDYTLCPSTPNSYTDNPTQKDGKLTLKKISFLGKKGARLVPPVSFDYYNNKPYDKDKTDIWGFYKSDFDLNYSNSTNDVIGRLTTDQSALEVDAWSLNEIKTSLGSTIVVKYESDEYENVALAKSQLLRTKEVTDYGTDKLKLTFWETGFDLAKYFEVGKSIDIDLMGAYFNKFHTTLECTGDCDDVTIPYAYDPFLFSSQSTISEINISERAVVIEDHNLYDRLKNETKVYSNGIFIDMTHYHKKIFYKFHYGGDQAWPDYFPAGIVSASQKEKPGGGIRVHSVTMLNSFGDDRVTEYEYQNGTTSYEPFGILPPQIHPDYPPSQDAIGTKSLFKKAVLKRISKQINIPSQLPGPGVMYGHVTVREKNITEDGVEHALPNYTNYEFKVFDQSMVSVTSSPVNQNGIGPSLNKGIVNNWLSKGSVNGTYDGTAFTNAYLNNVTVKDFSSQIGNLKSVTLYKTEDGSPINKTINHYLNDLPEETYEGALAGKFLNQGLIEESFTRSRIVSYKKIDPKPYLENDEVNYFQQDEKNLLATISKTETFPSIPVGQTSINYKTGVKNSTENIAFDFYSGEVTKILVTDSYGNRNMSVNIPAYKYYSGMGLKVDNKLNKNMLTQTAAEYSYVVNFDNNPVGVLSASIQTWTDQTPVLNLPGAQTNIWRPLASYQWNGQSELINGTYPFAEFHPYSFTSSSANPEWEKTGEIKRYDVNSHSLEVIDINGNFASTRLERNQQRVIASAVNASYDEMGYSGAEYIAGNTEKEGGIDRGDGVPVTAFAHTGNFSLLVGSGSKGFNYTLNSGLANLAKKYKASVWVYAPGITETQSELNKIELYFKINGVETKVHPTLQKNKSKSWYLLSIDIDPTGSTETYVGVRSNAQREVYFDDFRVHPLNASLTAFVYDNVTGELTYILDNNNFYTKFEYDAMGRLARTKKELLNFDFGNGKESFRADAVLKEFNYNYGKN
jgi:hypothetical protein